MRIISKLNEKLNKKTVEPSVYNLEYYNEYGYDIIERISYPTFTRPNNISHDDALRVLSYMRDLVYKLNDKMNSTTVKILNNILDSFGFTHIDTDELSTTLCIIGKDTKNINSEMSTNSIWYTPGVRYRNVKNIYKKAGLPLPTAIKLYKGNITMDIM